MKDQQQYWVRTNEVYRYVPIREFADAFQSFHVGQQLGRELSVPFDKRKSHPAALSTSNYGVSMKELLKACMSRELLLMKRNSFVYAFRAFQVCNIFCTAQGHKSIDAVIKTHSDFVLAAHDHGNYHDDSIPQNQHAP